MSQTRKGGEPAGHTPTEELSLHLQELASREPAEAGSAENLGVTSTTTDFIRKAISEEAAQPGTKVIVPRGEESLPAETILAIISYCYAKGVYSCRDIELAILKDQGLRATLGGQLPSDAALRRFRRLNRTTIQSVLEKTFIQAKHQFGHIPPDYPIAAETLSGSSRTGGVDSPCAGEETTFIARQAAADRMQKALFIDGMTRDS